MASKQQRIEQLRKLIQETHEHGLKLRHELITLDKQGKAKSLSARTKRALLRGLEALNHRRRVELEGLEGHPVPPKPPAPKPQRFLMLDTTTPGALQGLTFAAVAGYVGGKWPTYDPLVKLYPNKKHLSIAVNAGEKARCLDVEPGDATPADAPHWFRNVADHSQGKPVFYGDEENLVGFEEALRDAGIHRYEYYVWKADYTFRPEVQSGADAQQWTDKYAGRNIDASLCQPWFIG